MTAAPLSLEGKHLSRSGLVRMDPLGNFAVVAMAAQMTVETGVYCCSDNTGGLSHGLIEQAMDGWMWRWRRKGRADTLVSDGTVIVMGDDTNAALGEQYFPRQRNSLNPVAREAGDLGCWYSRLVKLLWSKETLAVGCWKIEVTSMGLSLGSEEQLRPVEGAKNLNRLHPCRARLDLLVRFRSKVAGAPDDCLFPLRSVVREPSSSPICFGQFSAVAVLRCYRPALS